MRWRRKSAAFLLFLVCSLVFGKSEVIEEIVAIVNDDIITLSQYKQYHDTLYQMLRAQFQGEEFEKQYSRMKGEILDNMITELLLLQLAREKKLNVSEQVKETVERIKKENEIASDEELRYELSRQGIDYEQWLKQMEENLMRQALIFTEVDRTLVLDDSEIVNYYKLHPEEFVQPEEYQLRAVYLSSEHRSEEELGTLKKEIERGIKAGADFAEMAGQYADEPLRGRKGDLGSFKKGQLEKSLQDTVEKLRPGEISSWVQVRGGWYLLKLESKKESRLMTFEEVKKDIEEKIFSEKRAKKLKEFLTGIREKSYIKILKPNPLNL